MGQNVQMASCHFDLMRQLALWRASQRVFSFIGKSYAIELEIQKDNFQELALRGVVRSDPFCHITLDYYQALKVKLPFGWAFDGTPAVGAPTRSPKSNTNA
jgi:hypothetical protein